jgi:outer membrane receptor protein involved in Fe transport
MRVARVWSLIIAALVGDAADIRVRVQDSSGAPMAAEAIIENTGTGERRAFRIDAVDGGRIVADAPGSYRLIVHRESFVSRTERLVLSDDKPREIQLQLAAGAPTFVANVVAATALPGADLDATVLPTNLRVASEENLHASGGLEIADFLNRRMNGVFLNEIQGNPFQPDLNFRGYTASPLLGTPQGISLFLDGVRVNQPFGDVVSWDLLPRAAISEVTLIPGSNPLFGLNTLGGAISLRTKDGVLDSGTKLAVSGGSFSRLNSDFEHGASRRDGLNWFVANSFLFEKGWRDSSNSNVRQFFGRLGRQSSRSSISLTASYANNGLLGNGLQEFRLLEQNYSSVYTKPDLTASRAPSLTLLYRRALNSAWSVSSNAYFRYVRSLTLNGDINEESLDQSLYQPNAAEQAALRAAGLSGFPLSGENAANTPFPRWRCIANVLLRDEPSEKCNGLINVGASQQRNYGLSVQVSRSAASHQFTAGGAFDGNSVGFRQSSELGYLNPDRTVTGLGAFGDGVTGGTQDGEAFDTRVHLSSRVHSFGFYATDTFRATPSLAVTISGRFNRVSIDNADRIRPLAGPGSLTGQHSYQRFNPAAGLTYRLTPSLQTFFNYSEGSRAPTAIELGCADPNTPCKLPNALAGDPPLRQVLTRSFEAGARSAGESVVRWSAAYFHLANRDDILFVASEQTGFGYFKNFGRTRREGIELDGSFRVGAAWIGAGYTFLDATYQSGEQVNGEANSSNDDEFITIQPGDRLPILPRHVYKLFADVPVAAKLTFHAGLNGASASTARGNENGLHVPDGQSFLGPGGSPGFAVVNLGATCRLSTRAELFVNTNNVFDRRFYSASQLGPAGILPNGNFIARPLPPSGGEYPIFQSTFFAPGAPRAAWLGLRLRF